MNSQTRRLLGGLMFQKERTTFSWPMKHCHIKAKRQAELQLLARVSFSFLSISICSCYVWLNCLRQGGNAQWYHDFSLICSASALVTLTRKQQNSNCVTWTDVMQIQPRSCLWRMPAPGSPYCHTNAAMLIWQLRLMRPQCTLLWFSAAEMRRLWTDACTQAEGSL